MSQTLKSTPKNESNWKIFFNIFPASVASQLVFMSVGVINALMAAKVSVAAMAAIGMIGSIYWSFNSLGLGLLSVVLSKMSFAFGQGNYSQVGNIHRQTYYVILLASIFIIGCDLILAFNLDLFHLSPEMIAIAKPYMLLCCLNVPLFIFIVHLRNINACIAYTLPTLIVSILGLILIVPLNFIFMYQDLPFIGFNPAHSAFSHIIINLAYISVMLLIFKYKSNLYGKLKLFNPIIVRPNWSAIKDNFKIGTPVAFQYWLENSFYALVVLLIAHLGTSIVGAHEAAMSTYSVAYALAISGSASITSIVSRRLGEQRRDLAQNLFRNVIYFLIIFNIFSGMALILFRENIADLFISNDQVAHDIAQNLLIFLAFANFFDNIYACFLGYLISFRDSRFAFLVAFIVSWCLGIPLASLFALTDWLGVGNYGIYAYWTVFICIPLVASAVCFIRVQRKWHTISDQALYQRLEHNLN
ncbi:MATE family efflux transporter [Psittacicella gerlachiana]|uniref:MATE family multidrug resistance protein n=1 Tax=Psittacicella gerlachiana TaxID=2028574 RepID=A0A3A1YHU6_9GAMM|nr:MATE family efflux transporter [Psittacicella gerlachiana]RIY37181.1 hypothetical protein CKF59_01900 [Psittacicella gerlachiana]